MGIEAIINAIAATGVIVSVFFLAIQTKKSTKYVKANYYDSLVNQSNGFLQQLVENKDLAKLFEAGVVSWNSLSEDDKRTANFLFIQLFRMWENMFYQNRMKILEPWLWDSHKNTIMSYFHYKGVQEWWAHRRQTFSEEYRIFLENSEKPNAPIKMIEDIGIY